MFCRFCGNQCDGNERFCAQCGKPLAKNGKVHVMKKEAKVNKQISIKKTVKEKINKTIPVLVGLVLVYFVALSIVLRMVSVSVVKKTEMAANKTVETKQEQTGLKNIQVGDIVTLGVYEQDSILDNGKEPIEWDVIAEKDGKFLLLSHYILDSHRYDEGKSFNILFANQEPVESFVTWEKSAIRAYLNNNFYNTAFTEEEKKYICLTTNTTGDWAEFNDGKLGAANVSKGGLGGEDTQDYVFLLSIEEIRKYFSEGKFEMWGQPYNTYYANLLASPTLYAIERGINEVRPDDFFGSQKYFRAADDVLLDENGYDRNHGDEHFWNHFYYGKVHQDYLDVGYFSNWGLRSPGCYNNAASYLIVYARGCIRVAEQEQESDSMGVRPAMWIEVAD